MNLPGKLLPRVFDYQHAEKKGIRVLITNPESAESIESPTLGQTENGRCRLETQSNVKQKFGLEAV